MFFLGTNWKMNKSFEESDSYVKALMEMTNKHSQFNYFIIPPYTHLNRVKEQISSSNIMIGAQNMHWMSQGAYTGEISPQWLNDIGIDIVELGHSERRQYYCENDEDINKKIQSALNFHLTPLLCIGENKKEKMYAVTKEVIRRQIKIALYGLSREEVKKVWVAYEPVWSIGEGGIPAEPNYVEEVHGYIREQLVELFEMDGKEVPIFYGGSVNPENSVSFAQRDNVNGLFIGRSAWDIISFEKIINQLEAVGIG